MIKVRKLTKEQTANVLTETRVSKGTYVPKEVHAPKGTHVPMESSEMEMWMYIDPNQSRLNIPIEYLIRADRLGADLSTRGIYPRTVIRLSGSMLDDEHKAYRNAFYKILGKHMFRREKTESDTLIIMYGEK